MNVMIGIKNRLLSSWSWLRIIRLGLGASLLLEAIHSQTILIGVLAIYLLFQVWHNSGCRTGQDDCAVH